MALPDVTPSVSVFSRASAARADNDGGLAALRAACLALNPQKFYARWNDAAERAEIPLRVDHVAQASSLVPLIENNPAWRAHAVFFFGQRILRYEDVVIDLSKIGFDRLREIREPASHPRLYLTPLAERIKTDSQHGRGQILYDAPRQQTYCVYTRIDNASPGFQDRYWGQTAMVQENNQVPVRVTPVDESNRDVVITLSAQPGMSFYFHRPHPEEKQPLARWRYERA